MTVRSIFLAREKVAITGCFLKKGMSLIVQSFAQLDPISYLKFWINFFFKLLIPGQTFVPRFQHDGQKFFPLENIFP